ncbi:hypothetical protein JJL56_01980 [Azospirillum sp. YIM DDC1]|uniref:Uncharacterized protein n=1 Tax=Azospirillum aestuarii TaxID=2802052 RepID=A0ABS1HS30_9PROT|nr:hypothetical protein [Azospirillum aestuarii]MBK4717628.1 hypothetical protein [Azospirillum aestuarii]
MAGGQKWAFKTKLRARAFGWRGSQAAIARLKEAVSEIRTVSKIDPLTAGEGALALMERLWPAFEQIDTSTGALGSAVHKALDEVIPILIAAPADPKTRAKWLERLYQAVLDDGVQYLFGRALSRGQRQGMREWSRTRNSISPSRLSRLSVLGGWRRS